MSIADLLDEFARLTTERLELEGRITEIKTRIVEIEPAIIDDWVDRGVSRVTVQTGDSKRTVSLGSAFKCWKKPGVPTSYVCDALIGLGLADMVQPNYNPSAIKSLVAEHLDQGEVPQALQDVLTYFDQPVLRTIRS